MNLQSNKTLASVYCFLAVGLIIAVISCNSVDQKSKKKIKPRIVPFNKRIVLIEK